MDADGVTIQLTDNSSLVLSEPEAAVSRAPERCGQQAEGYAKDLCPVDSGALRKPQRCYRYVGGLGHADITMTGNVYGHLFNERKATLAEQLEGRLKAAGE